MLKKWQTAPFRLVRAVGELIFPPCCALCRGLITDHAHTLCPNCWQQFQDALQPHACPTCGHNVGPYALIRGRCHRCRNRRPLIGETVRIGQYQGLLRELILKFKYQGQANLDQFFGSLLAQALAARDELSTVQLLIPIPMYTPKRWLRKYNQAELLARAASVHLRRSGRPVKCSHHLLRIRPTRPQSRLTLSQRVKNLRNAFAVYPRNQIAGKHICLIDDITTSGATLRTAARVLKRAGAARVSAAVIAVAANNPD